MKRLALLATGLAIALCVGAASADAPGVVKVSNETTLTRYANPNDRSPIRTQPSDSARVVARLRLETEDGFPEVYLVLNRLTEANGDVWYEIRIPMRPNGKTGWVREDALGPLQTVRTQAVVNRKTLRLTLFRRGRKVFQAPVGIGKRSTPTPPGHFWIRERLVISSRGSFYGPLAFGTADYSNLSDWPKGGVVGIHGTSLPQLIPGRPSHGCIRMRNRDIVRLGRLMPIGTPLLVI